ncbi:hypothetical protein [Polaromonas vacuolata]|uniref:hypothetical protein n=1 Tax=Polaromonas vacuolata TaxID=37448 RepID=UPI001456E4A0|nr:hypothetical protein [Polaromonas vacuolata]
MNTPSQAAIGRALMLSPATITKNKKLGMPVYSIEAAQAWRVARQNVAARKPAPPVTFPTPSPPRSYGRVGGDHFQSMIKEYETEVAVLDSEEDHDAARTRLRISEANLSEMKEAEEKGSLIRLDAVKAVLSVAMATAREALLQIPSRMAPLLAAESDPGSVQNLLYAEIHQALELLSGASVRLGQQSADLE